jgi:hypothetical protein
LPDAGFEDRIRQAVNDIWIIDTHEHLSMEEDMIKENEAQPFDFTHLFVEYIRDDLRSAGYIGAIEQMVNNRNLPLRERWHILEPFWNATRNTGYARVVVIAAKDLYGIEELNSGTVELLSDNINKSYQPGWYKSVLKDRARIDLSILDIGHIKPDTAFYYHVERFEDFVSIYSKSDISEVEKKYNVVIRSLDNYVSALRSAFKEGLEYGMIGVKSALSYQRPIYYENVDKPTAEQIFMTLLSANSGAKPLDFPTVKPLQDFMMHRLLDLAQEYNLPVQIHTGLHAGGKNEIRNSHPALLTNLFKEYPNVNFCIFHSSYPYGAELSVLAKNYPNVLIDMCWSHVISPFYCERYLHEWLETVPASKIMAFGGDYGHVENAYAHAVMARRVVAKVLIEKTANGYFSEAEAIDVARRLLRNNALEIFKLRGKSRDMKDLPSPSADSDVFDLWEAVKKNSGIISEWMVIGPFPSVSDKPEADAVIGFHYSYSPEFEILFNKTYSGEGVEINWSKVKTGDSGVINFERLYHKDKAIAYAYTEVFSPDERLAKFSFGSDDGAKIWINGKLVYEKRAHRIMQYDGYLIKSKLKKGKNTILAKVENEVGGWQMMMRILDPNNELTMVKWYDE